MPLKGQDELHQHLKYTRAWQELKDAQTFEMDWTHETGHLVSRHCYYLLFIKECIMVIVA